MGDRYYKNEIIRKEDSDEQLFVPKKIVDKVKQMSNISEISMDNMAGYMIEWKMFEYNAFADGAKGEEGIYDLLYMGGKWEEGIKVDEESPIKIMDAMKMLNDYVVCGLNRTMTMPLKMNKRAKTRLWELGMSIGVNPKLIATRLLMDFEGDNWKEFMDWAKTELVDAEDNETVRQWGNPDKYDWDD